MTMLRKTTLLALPVLLLAGPALAAGGGHGDDHGIPWTAIGQHAVNLAVLLGFLGFVLRKRIPDALRARKAAVADDIASAQQARDAARARAAEIEARLAGFEQELASMRAEAEEEANKERELILAKAEAAAANVAAGAKRSIEAETRRAQQTLRADAAALAVQLAAEQIKQQFTAEDDQRLTGDFLDTITRDLAGDQGVTRG